MTFSMPGGTYTMQDTYTCTSSTTLTFGTLDAGNQSITMSSFASNNSNTRTLNM